MFTGRNFDFHTIILRFCVTARFSEISKFIILFAIRVSQSALGWVHWPRVCLHVRLYEQVIIRKRGRLIKLFSLYIKAKFSCMAFENEDPLGSADGRMRLNCSEKTRGHLIRWTYCSLHNYFVVNIYRIEHLIVPAICTCILADVGQSLGLSALLFCLGISYSFAARYGAEGTPCQANIRCMTTQMFGLELHIVHHLYSEIFSKNWCFSWCRVCILLSLMRQYYVVDLAHGIMQDIKSRCLTGQSCQCRCSWIGSSLSPNVVMADFGCSNVLYLPTICTS